MNGNHRGLPRTLAAMATPGTRMAQKTARQPPRPERQTRDHSIAPAAQRLTPAGAALGWSCHDARKPSRSWLASRLHPESVRKWQLGIDGRVVATFNTHR